MWCEVCGAEATFGIDEVNADTGQIVQRSLCDVHARQSGFPDEPSEFAHFSARIKALIAFIRAHNRMPDSRDFEAMGGAGDLSGTQPGTQAFTAQLAFLEALAAFIDREGRMPTDDELPEPF